MDSGRRYDDYTSGKLNLKKIVAIIIAIVVIVMIVFIIKNLLTKGDETGRIVSSSYYTSFKDNKWGVIDSNRKFSYRSIISRVNNNT